MGHFTNWYLYGSTFKFCGATSLPKPNLSNPPPAKRDKNVRKYEFLLPKAQISKKTKKRKENRNEIKQFFYPHSLTVQQFTL